MHHHGTAARPGRVLPHNARLLQEGPLSPAHHRQKGHLLKDEVAKGQKKARAWFASNENKKSTDCMSAMRLPSFPGANAEITMTYIILNWSRRDKVLALIRKALRHPTLIHEIIIWNNHPDAFPRALIPETDKVRIVNSQTNRMDRAKYEACGMANTQHCLYSDDDWDVFPYLDSLVLAYSRNSHLVHTTTESYTWYTNMIEWVYHAPKRGIHSRFGWIGCGSIIPRPWAKRHLLLLDSCVPSDDHVLADVLFLALTNQYQIQTEVDIIPSIPIPDNHVQVEQAIGLHPKQRPLQLQIGAYLKKVAKATEGILISQSDCVVRSLCRSPQICALCTNFLPSTPRQGFLPSDAKENALRTRDNLPKNVPFRKHPYSHALDDDDETFWDAVHLNPGNQWGILVQEASNVDITCVAQENVRWRVFRDGLLVHDDQLLCPKSSFQPTHNVTFEYIGTTKEPFELHSIWVGNTRRVDINSLLVPTRTVNGPRNRKTFPLNPNAFVAHVNKCAGVSFDMFVHDPNVCTYISKSLLNGGWECYIMDQIAADMQCGHNEIFMDIGSNIGAFSLTMANLGHTVFAFEAMQYNIELQQASLGTFLDRNGNVHLFHMAASDESGGEVCIHPAPEGNSTQNRGNGQVYPGPCAANDERIPRLTINEVVSNYNDVCVRALKIDVEGYETKALRGASNLFLGKCPPCVVYMEYTELYTIRAGVSAKAAFDFLKRHGYTCSNIEHSDWKCVNILPAQHSRCHCSD